MSARKMCPGLILSLALHSYRSSYEPACQPDYKKAPCIDTCSYAIETCIDY